MLTLSQVSAIIAHNLAHVLDVFFGVLGGIFLRIALQNVNDLATTTKKK